MNTEPQNKFTFSRGFADWLKSAGISLAFTSYESGELFLCGLGERNRISVQFSHWKRPMGLAFFDGRLVMGTRSYLWAFTKERPSGPHDATFVPRLSHLIGDCDYHEIAIDKRGDIFLANTSYSTIVRSLDVPGMFSLRWKPDFVSAIVPEDRCHLNGIGLCDGELRYATVCSRSDVLNGWKANRMMGGCVYDINSGRLLVPNQSMPHSPRHYKDVLWHLDSGRGYIRSGAYDAIFCPGFLRGLTFHRNYALVTVSLPRDGHFSGLELDAELRKRSGEPMCGILIINLDTGAIEEWLRIEGATRELFDVCIIENANCPMAVQCNDDATLRNFAFFEPQEQRAELKVV